jgi:hypothetical protein
MIDPFKNKIYAEFEENLYRILNISLDEYRGIFEQHNDDPFEEFETVYANDGAEKMRITMNWAIVNLSVIYQERELGRKMTGPELKVHDEGLGLELGLT